MVKDNIYIHLQFTFDDIEEAEEAKQELKELIGEKFPYLESRLYRKKEQVRWGIPYDGFFEVIKNHIENPDGALDPTKVIADFIDNFDVCLDCDDIEISFWWHVKFEPDDEE